MELKLVALYGREPSRVGADAGSRVAEFGLRKVSTRLRSRDELIDTTFEAPKGWLTIDEGTRELVYSGPPIHTVVPATQEFNVDIGLSDNELALHLVSIGMYVEECKTPGVRVGSRALWCADSLVITGSNVESIDLRGTPVCELTVRRCRYLETIRSTERVRRLYMFTCYELKLVDGIGENLDTLDIGTMNTDLRIEGRSRFSSVLKNLHMETPIASIPFVPMHLIKDVMTDWTYKENYSHTRFRMRIERGRALKRMFMVWHARLGGTRTDPKHPSLLRYAFEFLYCI